MTRGQQTVFAAAFAAEIARHMAPGDAAFIARETVEAIDNALVQARGARDELTVAMLEDVLSTGGDR